MCTGRKFKREIQNQDEVAHPHKSTNKQMHDKWVICCQFGNLEAHY